MDARISAHPGSHVRPGLAGLLSSLLVIFAACNDSTATDQAERVDVIVIEAGNLQIGEVGTELASPLVVRLEDELGSPVAGVVVRFRDITQSLEVTARSDAQGRASTGWQLGPSAGPTFIVAFITEPNARPSISFSAEARAGPPTRLTTIGGDHRTAVMGSRLDRIGVTAFDRFGNASPDRDITWTVQAGDGSVEPLSERTDENGLAWATWTLGLTVGPQILRVASGPVIQMINATAVPALVATQVVSGSDHSCAIIADGSAYCWGSNAFGQLGNGARDLSPHPTPIAVAGRLKFKAITVGAVHTCGLTLMGEAYCWGDNRAGQAGLSLDDAVPLPTRVPGAPLFATIAAGGFHACGVTDDGSAHCWGDNSHGQLGDGADRSPPLEFLRARQTVTPVAGPHRFASLRADYGTTCGVTTSGDAMCWGWNNELLLGSHVSQTCRVWTFDEFTFEVVTWDVPCSSSPVRVTTRAPATSLVMDMHNACALLATSELECWGVNSPPQLVPGARVSQAWALWFTVCGPDSSGTVACWRSSPPFGPEQPFGAGPALFDLHSSGRHHCGLSRSSLGVVYCWGTNYEGALGDGTTQHREYPVPVVDPLARLRLIG